MPRIPVPETDHVPVESRPVLDGLARSIGFTPNMLATFAQSPIAFNAWSTLRKSLGRSLDLPLREMISLAVSEVNGCDYCVAAHAYAATKARMSPEDIELARKGRASDPKRDAAVQFARQVISYRGHVDADDLRHVRDAGYTDANVMEIIALVAAYTLTNLFNNVFDTEHDYPPVAPAGSL